MIDIAIAVYFHPEGLTLKDYHETHRRLTEAGAGQPAGRLHHSCFGEDGRLMIYDLWESRDAFEAFGPTLMPILAELGIDPGEPATLTIHRLEQTSAAT